MAIIVNPTAAEFKQMLAEKKTFLADFYATWCGPCKMLSYVLEDIDKEMGERIDIVKIDIDKEPELTEEMDITIGGFDGILPFGREIERYVMEGNLFSILTCCHARYCETVEHTLDDLLEGRMEK